MTKPKYSIWEAINIALALASKALELARQPGPAGADGKDGADGQNGTDGQNGRDGIDGKDGVGVDDITAEFEDDGRVDVLRFWWDGKVVKEIRRPTKTTIWRGVWAADRTYLPGDEVTWKNSIWYCQKEVTGVIGGGEHWSLKQKRPREVKPEDVAKFLSDRS